MNNQEIPMPWSRRVTCGHPTQIHLQLCRRCQEERDFPSSRTWTEAEIRELIRLEIEALAEAK
jgi:hypothetical protein